ncbi:hypothetical protein L227DRAFT_650872 [Lentinus tigrinus ALCF2SS1-6]|uniref:THO1-MOS11 C-terminal domain-containing protein n=1 Tax=Lentinus tigrinus ALCF2SS1-6 TaxID=1328759 RepID=A0A5C2SJT1_9APHY|nr:hypothetical protein L227DRAFT_650872 [Lentinus tigrinus ALCF2SS1-6]
MESKLHVLPFCSSKALKVVDLKDILSKANVAITGKANKQDLIAKILASPDAVDVYNQIHGPAPAQTSENASAATESSPATSEPPPKASAPTSKAKAAPAPAASSKPPSQTAPEAAPAPSSPKKAEEPSTNGDAVKPPEDEEAAKRRARAERFGIPLVEPKPTPLPTKKGKPAANGKNAKATRQDDPDKLAARAARFGTKPKSEPQAPTGKNNGRKRQRDAALEIPADAEELERRKKRAERFGTGTKPAAA